MDPQMPSTALRVLAQLHCRSLPAKVRAGFAEVSMVLVDHVDRPARLETAAGLPRVRD